MKSFNKIFEEKLKAEIVSNVNEKAMEEKLNEITHLYVDRLLEMLKNPDADIWQINACVRVIDNFRQWGTIQFPNPADCSERPKLDCPDSPIVSHR